MTTALQLLREGRTRDLWNKYCGFIDLSLSEFLNIQRNLLLEQIDLLGRCELGRVVMRGARPKTVDEFRREVPITTYLDYAPYLLSQREEMLPEPAMYWQRTSGRSGEYPAKWMPVTQRWANAIATEGIAIMLFSACKDRYHVPLEEHDTILYAIAPPPFATGTLICNMNNEFNFDWLPPVEQAEKMTFEERLSTGFSLGMTKGIDFIMALSSVLIRMGEQFVEASRTGKRRSMPSHPAAFTRVMKGVLKSRMAGRPLMPKDLWTLKGLMPYGMDTHIYRSRIHELWGRHPLEVYAGTEIGLVAVQTWDYDAMTFFPDLCFFEFIPESELQRAADNNSYEPSTLLLDEVEPGKKYELVVTNFHGGPFVRYRSGDMIEITALRNQKLNIDIPQMQFYARADGLIDLAGFTRLTEQIIWQALATSGIPFEEWTARKETQGSHACLHLYLEPKDGQVRAEEVRQAVHERLKELDRDYADVENVLGINPLGVTLLSQGTFEEYMSRQRGAGAEPAHWKPTHMNPRDMIVSTLLEIGRDGRKSVS
ncbi:MAG: GH3 auxin-responsive promoter family protein [Bacteroidetes bacterium]|nr:GH3 auxin-responsive promoter family protein [Bacteroidota bacterium]MCL5026521.1 GH3 auxin-responsive promoter family protein [Chloroflexota bacterium]